MSVATYQRPRAAVKIATEGRSFAGRLARIGSGARRRVASTVPPIVNPAPPPNDRPDRNAPTTPASPAPRRGAGAALVAAGILLSRLAGLVRERVFAHHLGNGLEAAAFRAALRIPNFLQNLFGEGVLSASFIPVYAGLSERDPAGARRLASAILGLLSLVTSLLVAGGMLLTPQLIDLIAPGFEGEARALTIRLVRVLFPGTGMLVLSAWCLAILNSHRRFFLSYAAPVLWNAAIIAALLWFGGRVDAVVLAERAAWGAVAGSAMQLLVQLPTVVRLLGGVRPTLDRTAQGVARVVRSFLPVVGGRGVVQLSAYLDTALASLVSPRALSGLSYVQVIYLLPVSLFGMAVSAAELPELAREAGGAALDEAAAARVRARVEAGRARMAYFVVPSAVAFFLLGDVVAAALLQTGRFDAAETRYAWYLLAGSAVGLVASTEGRLYASALYALGETRAQLFYAGARVLVASALGALCVWLFLGVTSIPRDVAAVGLTALSGVAAWLERRLLRGALERRVGALMSRDRQRAQVWAAALVAGLAGLGLKAWLSARLGAVVSSEPLGALLPMPQLGPWQTAALVLSTVALVFGAMTWWLGVPQAQALMRRLRRRRG